MAHYLNPLISRMKSTIEDGVSLLFSSFFFLSGYYFSRKFE